MQLRFYAFGIHVGIPKTPIGVDFLSAVYLVIRTGPNGPQRHYEMIKGTIIGNRQGNSLLNAVSTDWMTLNRKENESLCNSLELQGTDFNVEITEFTLGDQRADVTLRSLDSDKRPLEIAQRVQIAVKAIMFSDMRLTGKFVKASGNRALDDSTLDSVCKSR